MSLFTEVNRNNTSSKKERMHSRGTRSYRGRGGGWRNWLTSGSPIRATIRHELHSHAHLHTRLYINIRSGRKTGPALHTGPPARVISPLAGISVGHRVADPEKGVAQNTPRGSTSKTPYVSMNSRKKRIHNNRALENWSNVEWSWTCQMKHKRILIALSDCAKSNFTWFYLL